MAGGAAYQSPEKPAGKPQAAWNGTDADKGNGVKRTRRNSIMELLDKHGDKEKQLIDRAGFDALCDQLGLRLNAIEKRRAFISLDALDEGRKDGKLEYSYVRRHTALRHDQSRCLVISPERAAVQVHAWVKDKRQMQLRAARQLARKLFDLADSDSSGFLDKAEVTQVERRLVQRCPEVLALSLSSLCLSLTLSVTLTLSLTLSLSLSLSLFLSLSLSLSLPPSLSLSLCLSLLISLSLAASLQLLHG